MKKTAASLILFTKIPHRGLVAILNKRGSFNYESFKPESYPGFYEPTISGGIESQEHLIEGLLREAEEEMGSEATKLITHYASQLHHVAHRETEKISAYTYALFIPHLPLAILKPSRSSAGIRPITEKETKEIKGILSGEYDKRLPPPDGQLWMLSDSLEGLKRAFELYKHL